MNIGNNKNTMGLNQGSSLGFNPFKIFGIVYQAVKSALDKLIEKCGLSARWTPLESYQDGYEQQVKDLGLNEVLNADFKNPVNGQLIDSVGNETRTAYLAKGFVGDGSMYLDLDADLNIGTRHKIELNCENLTTGSIEILFGQQATDDTVFYLSGTNQFIYRSNDMGYVFNVADITLVKEIELIRNDFDISLYANGVLINTITMNDNVDFILGRFLAWYNLTFKSTAQINTFKITNTDTNEVILELINEDYDSTNQTIPLKKSDGTAINGQIVLPSANPVQDIYTEESLADIQGYTVSDGATYYYDNGGANLVPLDVLMTANADGTLSTYLANVTRPQADNKGAVKKNFRIVDGVAYSGENNSEWEFVGTGTGTDGTNITIVNDGGTDRARHYNMVLKPSTLYTCVLNISSITTTDWLILGSQSDIDSNMNLQELTGEYRFTFTTSASIVFNGLTFTVTNGDITFNGQTFRVYEGDYVTGSPALPTSGQYTSGNSVRLSQSFGGVLINDPDELLMDKTTGQPVLYTVDEFEGIFNDYLYGQRNVKTNELENTILYDGRVDVSELAIVEDTIGDESRDAVPKLSIVGDGSTYLETEVVVLSGEYEFNFSAILNADNEFVVGSSSQTSKIGRLSGNLFVRAVDGGASDNTLTVDFTSANDITIKRDSSNIITATVNGTETTLFGGAPQAGVFTLNRIMNDDTASEISGNLFYFNFKDIINNLTYTLIPESFDSTKSQYTMTVSDGTNLTVQQFNVPATPLEINYNDESSADELGYSVSKARGKNLFDKTTATDNVYIDRTSGIATPDVNYFASEFILIEPNTEYTLSQLTGSSFKGNAYYDNDMNYISGDVLQSFTTPSNAKYARVSFNKANSTLDNAQLEVGSTPTSYESYIGYYRDRFLSESYSQGTIIPTDERGVNYAYSGLVDEIQYPQAILGDGTTYIEATGYTDADLPLNHEIEFEGVYLTDLTQIRGFFGFSGSGAQEYNTFSRNSADRIRLELYGAVIEAIPPNLTSGDRINIKSRVIGNQATLLVDDVEYGTSAITRVPSLENLVILARSDGSSEGTHTCYKFTITNTDTGETLTLNTVPNSENQYVLIPSNPDVEPIICQQFNVPAIPTSDIENAESMHTDYGLSIQTPVTPYDDDSTEPLSFEEVVDGVVDNGVNYENWTTTTVSNDSNDSIDVTVSSEALILLNDVYNVKTSNQYTIVFDIDINTLDSPLRISSSSHIFNSTGTLVNSGQTGEIRALITSETTLSGSAGFRATNSTTTGRLKCTCKFYEGDLTSGALPNSGSWESGNSKVGRLTYDKLGQDPVPQGEKIPNLPDGKTSSAYVNGVHPVGQYTASELSSRTTSQFKKRVKYDIRIVDGVVDNGANSENLVDYSKWMPSPGDENQVELSVDGIKLTSDGVNTIIAEVNSGISKASTLYTAVMNVLETTSLGGTFGLATTGVNDAFVTFDSTTLGEQRKTFTTDVTITTDLIRTLINSSMTSGQFVRFTLTIYEGDYVTENPQLPQSALYTSGNSFILNDTYTGVNENDPNNILTNPDGTNKLVVIDDTVNIDHDQFLINLDGTELLWFEGELQEPCITEALEYLELIEPLEDINGSPLKDIDGSPLYALKEGVERKV